MASNISRLRFCLQRPQCTIHNASRMLCGVALFALFVMPVHGQGGSLPLGNPGVVVGNTTPCPSAFYSNSAIPAVCHLANLAGCANASNLNFIYSYDNPGSPLGTIVFFAGDGGTSPFGDDQFADFYFSKGFEIVQIQWAYDWEDTTIPVQYTGGTVVSSYTPNVQLAACRQATFLSFVFNMGNTTLYSGGGRCVQASSAGSAATAYALSYYGALNYIDLAEMKSGPPLSDIKQGCEVPNNIQTTVCGTQNGGLQYGCQLGGTSGWTLSPRFTGAANGVRGWTGDTSCANGAQTSPASNLAWLQQSIVDDGTNTPTFSYPKTAMTAWLCQTVYQGNMCVGGQGGTPPNDCPNNSSTQGEIFYGTLTSNPNNLPQSSYAIYAVQNCDGPEGVGGTTATVAAKNSDGGTDAIEKDVLALCVKPQ
jgi:hypothetical protein